MKMTTFASSILFAPLFFLLVGCESLSVPNPFRHDYVPEEVKAAPLAVQRAPELSRDKPWPRLGDVPAKPKDFTPKEVNDHYIGEMSYHRDEAEAARKAAQENPVLPTNAAPQEGTLVPPQFTIEDNDR